ncbi:ATP-binding protein [Oceanirhabdus sp. W0125-5]|uniref:ATP-binding protein n=1 Tax=Oceanirhabdus sp. W0125-5 TaxID=2999116 RepID=UPI0022F2FAE0|nr:4Fe-4S binding protein [Oceanirhabdus sp. W0125-5]WBW98420.1 4Fe-4S binding protein [Oceanirhabdus sp. W0125-5]
MGVIRKIVEINEEKCNGCGLCVTACHEGAIEMIDGKAKLIKDDYCDGLGDCLPACPTDAIKIIEREAAEYDEEAVEKRMQEMKEMKKKAEEKKHGHNHGTGGCSCQGSMAKTITRDKKDIKSLINEQGILNVTANGLNNGGFVKPAMTVTPRVNTEIDKAQLMQWPVQIKLVNVNAPYFDNADLLIAADCTAYAYANFHRDFIKGRITLIGCPKLDDNEFYKNKLAEIIKYNNIKSIKVVRMSVPCCRGIVESVKGAILQAGTIVPYEEVTIDTEGNIVNKSF